MKHNKEDQ